MLIELLYTSRAAGELTQDAVLELLETSRRNNANTGITGILVYHRQSFMQLLEGDEEAVMRLYQAILADPRHGNSRILWKGPIPRRRFGDWTMAFSTLDEVEAAQLPGFSHYLEEGFGGEPGDDELSVAQSLMEMLRDTL